MDQPRSGHLSSRGIKITKLQMELYSLRQYLNRFQRPNKIKLRMNHWRWIPRLQHLHLHLLFQWKPALHLTNLLPPQTQQLIVSLSTTSRSLTIYKKKRRSYNQKRQLKSSGSQFETITELRISPMQWTQRSNQSCELCTNFDYFQVHWSSNDL